MKCHLRLQQPFSSRPHNEPEPDAAVVVGTEDDYAHRRPVSGEVSCVIEVSDGSLGRDLGSKLLVYASAPIGQYAVVDLVNDVVLVRTHPNGGRYPKAATLQRGEELDIQCPSGTVSVPVERLLP
jgi:Uma2 family endonuclease